MDELMNTTPEKTSYERFKPIITIIIGLVCIGLYLGINLENTPLSWEIYKKWGAPSINDIFNGSYWGLITSNFLHVEIWHIAFNLYWLLIFGKKIEFEASIPFYVFLIISSALVSSLAEIGLSDSTGIGLSGIGYALFGYIFTKSKRSVAYKDFLSNETINVFIIWLFLCIILTQTNIWKVGNAAHVSGLIWGASIAFFDKSPTKKWVFESAIFFTIGTSFLWNPFSTSWLSYQAYQLHNNQEIDDAIIVYNKILERDSDNEFAKTNLAQLEKTKLYQTAYKFHSESAFENAKAVYLEILKLDANDEWAKENLKRLPER